MLHGSKRKSLHFVYRHEEAAMTPISCLISAHRKLTFIALFVLVVGWLLYLIGFCWELSVWTGEVDDEQGQGSQGSVNMSRSDSTLLPYYISLVGGPFLCLFEVLHALLPGVASCVFGAISAFVSTIYFISVGDVAFRSGVNITNTLYERSQFPHPSISVNPRVALRFSGVIIEGLSWMIILMVSQFYRYRSENVYRHVKWPFSLGYVRITSMAFIVLSAIGWCVYIAGEHSMNVNYIRPRGLYSLDEAGTFFVPPLLFLAGLLHAGCAGDAGRVIRAFVSILHMLFTIFMGSVVVNYSLAMHEYSGIFQGYYFAVKKSLGGSIASLLFWMLALSLWPFYYQQPSEMTANVLQQQLDVLRDDEQPCETQPLIHNT